MGTSFGLAMPQAGTTATANALITAAVTAERLGFDSLWLGDHIVVPEDIDSKYPYGSFTVDSRETYFDPLGCLGVLGGATKSISLGLSILVVPLRHPVAVGKQLATIDALTNGRVILGVGAGWLRSEFTALGMSESYFAQRGRVLDESIEIYRELWAHKRTSAFEGEFFSLPPVRAYPKPVSATGIPIWAGGNTEPALRRAARLDGWHALRVDIDQFNKAALRIEELRRAEGKHDPVTLSLRCFVGDRADGPAQDFNITGEPERVAEVLHRYIAAGCNHFIFDLQQWPSENAAAYLETAQWFAEEVRPLLTDA